MHQELIETTRTFASESADASEGHRWGFHQMLQSQFSSMPCEEARGLIIYAQNPRARGLQMLNRTTKDQAQSLHDDA